MLATGSPPYDRRRVYRVGGLRRRDAGFGVAARRRQPVVAVLDHGAQAISSAQRAATGELGPPALRREGPLATRASPVIVVAREKQGRAPPVPRGTPCERRATSKLRG